MPPGLKPSAPVAEAPARVVSWTDIVRNWDLVLVDLLSLHRINLYDPAILSSPWPGVRALILGLLLEPSSRLAASLRR